MAASSSSSSDWNEAVAHWSRVCELGMEAALREAGCSEESIVYIVGCFDNNEHFMLARLQGLMDTEPGRAVLLATFGRGDSRITTVMAPTEVWIMSEIEVTALCVNLSSNANIKSLIDLQGLRAVFGTVKGCTLLGHALSTNSTLTHLDLSSVGMGCDGMRCLVDGLQSNKNLLGLYLHDNPLSDEGVKLVAEFLKSNTTLTGLGLEGTGSQLEGATEMSSALGTNTTLRQLFFGVEAVGKEGMKRLLQPFSLEEVGSDGVIPDSKDPKNTSLKSLYLCGGNRDSLESIAHMIRKNKSLHYLGLLDFNRENNKTGVPFLSTDWTGLIFPALKENGTLKELSLNRCEGLIGEEVFESLTADLLQNSSTALQEIDIRGTGLQSRHGQVDEELRINREYRSRLRGQPQNVTTSGRVVLCGYGFAGKTEISKTMRRIEKKRPTFAHPFKLGWKKLMQRYPGLRQILHGRDAYKELTARTRGFQAVTLHKQPPLKSVWDFAGHKEYYALHDYVFPHMKNSYFLYVCSCRFTPNSSDRKGQVKDEKSMRRECEFWMRFLASNSKKGGRNLPRVQFVLTKTDTLDSRAQVITLKGIAKLVVADLKRVFENVLNLCETVEVVNALSSKDVHRLLQVSRDNLKEILADQQEYLICKEVRYLLEEWSKSNPKKAFLSVDEFCTLCKEQEIFDELEEDGWKVVLAYLNDLGEVIFPSKQADLIVTNPSWFGIDVLGSLIDAFKVADQGQAKTSPCCAGTMYQRLPPYLPHHHQGFVFMQDMKDHLEHSLQMDLRQYMSAEKLIELLTHLELCFKNKPGQETNRTDPLLFVPALFDDENETAAKGQRKLDWKLVQTGRLECLGRRLECEDRSTTFLTPGFFPRLQIHLWNYIHERKWTKNCGFAIGRNLIRFAENGVEVCVEYAGDNDDFVDILVRSSKPYGQALEFIEKHVVMIIRDFCASPQGCQGVVLVESVVRPVCVRNLHMCVERRAHSVRVLELEQKLKEDIDYRHTWSDSLAWVSDTDLALDLVKGEGSHNGLSKTQQAGPEDPLQEMSNLIEPLSTGTEQLPKLLYPSMEDVGIFRKVATCINLTEQIPIKLHLLCEDKDGPHKVEGQPGRTMKLSVTSGGYDVPLAKLAITFLWAGLGASVALPELGKWVDSLFDVPGLPALDEETLHQMLNTTDKPLGPISDEQIVQMLQRYWEADPDTQGMKEILNLDDGPSFFNDFRLQKIVYTEADRKGKVGWVCEKHYRGLQQQTIALTTALTCGI